jgi:uncharacterized protein DUF6268
MTRSLCLTSFFLVSAATSFAVGQEDPTRKDRVQGRSEAASSSSEDIAKEEDPSPASAVEETPAPEEGAPEEGAPKKKKGPPWAGPQEIDFSVETRLTLIAPTDLREGRSRLGVGRAGIKVGASRFLGPLKLTLSAGFERSRYDFREPDDIPGDFSPGRGEPFDELTTLRLQLGALSFLTRTWSAQLFVSARAGFETGADIDRSISLAMFLSAGYSFSREFTLTFGVGVLTRIEDDALVIPALGFRWTPTEWLTVQVRGPQVLVTADFEEWSTTLLVGFDNRQFRLDDRRSALAKNVVEDQRVSASLEFAWRPSEWLTLGASVGVALYQELRIRDSRGRSVETLRGDPTPFGGLRLEFTF